MNIEDIKNKNKTCKYLYSAYGTLYTKQDT